jgi:hypothetical protein
MRAIALLEIAFLIVFYGKRPCLPILPYQGLSLLAVERSKHF